MHCYSLGHGSVCVCVCVCVRIRGAILAPSALRPGEFHMFRLYTYMPLLLLATTVARGYHKPVHVSARNMHLYFRIIFSS